MPVYNKLNIVLGAPTVGSVLPSDFLNLRQWLKADSGITLNAGNVASWNDLSGNGNHMVQGVAVNQPLFLSGAINNFPAVQFNGQSNLLRNATMSMAGPLTLYYVLKQISFGLNKYLDYSNSAQGDAYTLYQVNTSPNISVSGGVLHSNLAPLNTYVIITVVYNSTTSSLQINNNSPITGATGTRDGVGLSIGGVHTFAGLNCNFELAERMIYAGVQTSGQISALKNYLQNKYLL
jgi:hypothetical protein